MPTPTDRVKCRGCNSNIKGQKHKASTYWTKLGGRVDTAGVAFSVDDKFCATCCWNIKKGKFPFGILQELSPPSHGDEYDAPDNHDIPQQNEAVARPETETNQMQIPDSVCEYLCECRFKSTVSINVFLTQKCVTKYIVTSTYVNKSFLREFVSIKLFLHTMSQ